MGPALGQLGLEELSFNLEVQVQGQPGQHSKTSTTISKKQKSIGVCQRGGGGGGMLRRACGHVRAGSERVCRVKEPREFILAGGEWEQAVRAGPYRPCACEDFGPKVSRRVEAESPPGSEHSLWASALQGTSRVLQQSYPHGGPVREASQCHLT